MSGTEDLAAGLARALTRAGLPPPSGLERLSGGASMESWRFTAGDAALVLRRAPSAEMMRGRTLDHAAEARVIRAARQITPFAPEIVAELEPGGGIGSGFVMRAKPGTSDPATILAEPEASRLLAEIATQLAEIHRLDPRIKGLAVMDTAASLAELRTRFLAYGGDRPIVALALRWLAANMPQPIEPGFVHGDFRMGNLMVHEGWLSGVLDWELAHAGDYHEDLAYACMTVWAFGRPDRPALGLGSIDEFLDDYQVNGGRAVDRKRFRFWLVYRTCWWALGCLQMGQYWRDGHDRSIERVVIGRRTAEQELDLLMLLEADAPAAERARELPPTHPLPQRHQGEPSGTEMLTAVSEWLSSAIKPLVSGRTAFDLAVARNALGIVSREMSLRPTASDPELAAELLAGAKDLATPGVLARLRRMALDKLIADMPKYPALPLARARWEGAD